MRTFASPFLKNIYTPGVGGNANDGGMFWDVNVGGTASVLNAARKKGIHVIVASTSAIYECNNKEDAPFKEELPVNPRLFYPLSKKLMEEVIQSYIKNYDMNITTLRFFNVFGPRQDIHRQSPPLLNYIVREIKQNRTPTFYSANGKPRDYIHVNDVVTLIEKCLNRTDRQIFNVCSGTLTSVKDIVGYAEKAFGKFDYIFKEPKMFCSEYPELYKGTNTIQDFVVENEVNKFSLGSTDKTRTLLDWNPNTDIESLMIDTMRINYERYSK